jgi:type IV secretion system protein VirB11
MSIKALERHLIPLLPFIKSDGVTEICINQPGEIFVEKNRHFTRHIVTELDQGLLEALAALIAEFNNKDFPSPLLSGSLPTGERIQFVMSPACENNKLICSIRRHQEKSLTLEDYQSQGAFDECIATGSVKETETDQALQVLYRQKNILGFIRLAIMSKKNILISGGTGTGKTTFLNACLKYVPKNERIITVEDTREVSVTQPNAVHLLFNEEDVRLSASHLFKTSLRLRPDRIFLSELRGVEVWPYLRAANSGHPGSITTVHADTPEGAFSQLVFMMQQAGSISDEERIRAYLHTIIPIVIQLKRSSEQHRFMHISDIYFKGLNKQE